MKRRIFLRRCFISGVGASLAWAAPGAEAQAQDSGFAPGAVAPTTPADPALVARLAQMGKRNARVHDPSTVIKAGDEYWVFCTGRGVSSWRSPDLLTWRRGPRVFNLAPAWTAAAVPDNRRMYYWAPDIIHVGGRYLLYYAVSTFGKKVSAIGLATNPALDPADPSFAWTDHGPVVQSGEQDDFNTIDPSVARDAHGGLWLAFGSFWSGIKLIQLDPATGLRLAPDSPMSALAHAHEIEASCVYWHPPHYYLFVDWGLCCKGVHSTYNIRVGRSDKITGPYLDQDGIDLLHGGGTLLLGSDGPFIGPGHAGILDDGGKFWFSCHFYDGTQNGLSYLAMRPLRWDAGGWPVLG
jgi:arabinan endo-1,5-alpha-L-arabinosidase